MIALPSWAYVGAEVICVKSVGGGYCQIVEEKRILTIRSIFLSHENKFGLRFNEIVNKPVNTASGFLEIAYDINCFQPVKRITLEDDMEIFHPLLETKGELV